nr:RNA-directed DNA polymerase, eukaryota, reverse transcriptase zinc-binding domain protein [Tanacetum cinerariifolium]
MYKIIAKILANRLVGVLGDIVDEVQSAFIADRQILDGSFILNEVLQWCKLKKKQSLIFKVDFEKANDSVRWDFLDDVLKKWNEVVERVTNHLSKWKMKALSVGEKGGLGVSSLYALNRGLMCKWVWRFYNHNTSLWARVIKAIHGDDGSVGKHVKVGTQSCWMTIVNEITVLKKHGIDIFDFMRIKLGNGDKLAHASLDSSFRRKPWGGAEQVQYEALSSQVYDVTLAPMSDRWTRSLESSGEFFVASIRKVIDDKRLPVVTTKTRCIKSVPIKVNVHAWKVKIDLLLTRLHVKLLTGGMFPSLSARHMKIGRTGWLSVEDSLMDINEQPQTYLSQRHRQRSRRLLEDILVSCDGYQLVKMNDPNITMEDYIRLEEEKARRCGSVYNWETATYGKIWYDENVHDLRSVETEFLAIVFDDAFTSKVTPSYEPMDSDSNVKEDTRSNNEFLADLNVEFQDRAFLAIQKRFYKRPGRVVSAKNLWTRQMKPVLHVETRTLSKGLPNHQNILTFLVKYNALKSEDEESLSSKDEGVTKVKAFMVIAEDEPAIGIADDRTEPIRTSTDVIPPTDLSQTSIISDKTKQVADKESLVKGIKKKAQTKPPSILHPSIVKKADSSSKQLLLTLIEEVKGLKEQIKPPSENSRTVIINPSVRPANPLTTTHSSQASSSKKAPKIPKLFIPCKDHLGKFDEKADDGFFLGYSLAAKAFRVFNIKRQEMEETNHVTFSEDDEAITQSKIEGKEINFNENRSFHDDEFLAEKDPRAWYETHSKFLIQYKFVRETLILPIRGVNVDDIADKSLSGTTVPLVTQSKAPTDNKSMK